MPAFIQSMFRIFQQTLIKDELNKNGKFAQNL